MRLLRLFKKDLAKEIISWRDDKLISDQQAQLLCERYDIDCHHVDDGSLGYRVLIFLGYLFIGISVIILLGANWDDIPRAIRMGGLMVLTMATHALALRAWLKNPDNGVGLFILGNLFYGASIILIAQIYHLGEHMPDGVFWWALGSLPFALLLRNSWLMLFSALLAMLWFFIEFGMSFYPALFPLFIIASLYVLLNGKQNMLLFLVTIFSVGMWVEVSLSVFWAEGVGRYKLLAEHLPVTAALFIFAHGAGHWLSVNNDPISKDYGVVLSLWALRFGLLLMLLLSFMEPWREMIRAGWAHLPSMWALMAVLLASAFFISIRAGHTKSTLVMSLFLIVMTIGVQLSTERGQAIYFQIIVNVALVAAGIWMIMRGINSGISHYFFLGVSTILLTAFMRYMDLIGDYIGGSILFMLLAALLLSAARYWRRQQQLAVMKEGSK